MKSVPNSDPVSRAWALVKSMRVTWFEFEQIKNRVIAEYSGSVDDDALCNILVSQALKQNSTGMSCCS